MNILASLARNVLAGFRLALFLPVSRDDFRIGAEHYAVLAFFNLLVWCGGSYVRTALGTDLPVEFVPSAVPQVLAFIPGILLACLILSRVLREDALFPVLAVMLASTDLLFEIIGSVIYVGVDAEWFEPSDLARLAIYSVYVLWAIASVLRTLVLVVPRPALRSARGACAAVLLMAMVLLLAYAPRSEPWVEVDDDESVEATGPSPMQEEYFHLQGSLLGRDLDRLSPQRPGIPDLYFLGAAADARQETFVRELSVVRKLMEDRFDADGRTIALMNHASTLGAVPIASVSNLRMSLAQFGEIMNVDEDVLVLFLTTHGSPQYELSFEFAPLQLRPVNPTVLARMLADSGIKWKVIVLSACYSGGFIEALKDDNTLVITAADATHTSFGCEAASDFTWFSKAYFDEALREEADRGSFSFTGAFERAKAAVTEREKAGGYEPSNPQMFVGNAMRDKLKSLEARLAGMPRPAP